MKLLLTFTGAIAALIGSKSAFAEYTLNMTKGITIKYTQIIIQNFQEH